MCLSFARAVPRRGVSQGQVDRGRNLLRGGAALHARPRGDVREGLRAGVPRRANAQISRTDPTAAILDWTGPLDCHRPKAFPSRLITNTIGIAYLNIIESGIIDPAAEFQLSWPMGLRLWRFRQRWNWEHTKPGPVEQMVARFAHEPIKILPELFFLHVRDPADPS